MLTFHLTQPLENPSLLPSKRFSLANLQSHLLNHLQSIPLLLLQPQHPYRSLKNSHRPNLKRLLDLA